jgi:predicted secreted protein
MPADIKEIKLRAGESTVIKLKGLATAGFEWNYTTDNKDCIKVSREFSVPGSGSQKMGESANEIFTILAQKKGIVNIHFSQSRSWEKTAPSNEEHVKIIIE